MNLFNVRRTFEDARKKHWDTLYVLVDVHGTITPSGRHDSFSFTHPDAKEVLQWITRRKDVKLILWTSSYDKENSDLIFWLCSEGIKVDYVNENPEAKNTTRACFDKKFYYNFIIDDRAGFEPATDWTAIKNELIAVGEWDKEASLTPKDSGLYTPPK